MAEKNNLNMVNVNDIIDKYEGTEELLYSDPSNPYESIYIRAKFSNGQLTVTDSECEHAPDGGWSHRILEFDKGNTENAVLMLIEKDPDPFKALKSIISYQDRTGIFREMCDRREIKYKETFAF